MRLQCLGGIGTTELGRYQRPLFGWGGWGRSRVFNERGDDITIADLTGTGAQDTAIASHVNGKLLGSDAGTVITA